MGVHSTTRGTVPTPTPTFCSIEYTSDIHDDTSPLPLSSPSVLPTVAPKLCPSDQVSSTIPKNLSITTEYLQKCTGFRNITSILNKIKSVVANTITISDIGRDSIKSRGETATMNKKDRNKIPVPHPSSFRDIFHYDIGHGDCTAMGGIKYAIFIVKCKTCHKFC